MAKGFVYGISLKRNSLTVKVSSCVVEDGLLQRHDLQSHFVFMMLSGNVLIRLHV